MADIILRPGKKRFTIALDQKPYEDFNALLRKLKAPRGTAAGMIDTFILGQVALLSHLLEEHKDGKDLSFQDTLMALSKMMAAIDKP